MVKRRLLRLLIVTALFVPFVFLPAAPEAANVVLAARPLGVPASAWLTVSAFFVFVFLTWRFSQEPTDKDD